MSATAYIPKAQTEDDISRMLVCNTHIGASSLNEGMAPYVYARNQAGSHIINLVHTAEKIAIAARVIAAVPNKADVCAIGARPDANRPVLKFAKYTDATPAAGRWTPGTLTNQITKKFMEPRVAVIADPFIDAQAIRECARANIVVIALCNADTPLTYVDIAIPCNNRTANSIGLIYWLLAREVLYVRGEMIRSEAWNVMPDMFFQKALADPEKVDSEAGAEGDAAGAAEAAVEGVEAENAGDGQWVAGW